MSRIPELLHAVACGFLVFLAAWFWTPGARAETIAATSWPSPVSQIPTTYAGVWKYSGTSATGSSPTAACHAQNAAYSGFWSSADGNWQCGVSAPAGLLVAPYCASGGTSSVTGGLSSGGAVVCTTSATGSCPEGYHVTGSNCTADAAYTCPSGQNWTLSGSNCTRPDCVLPQVRNAGTGVCETNCASAAGQTAASGYFDGGTSKGDANIPRAPCYNGCVATFSGSYPAKSALVNGVVHYYASGSYNLLNVSCTGSPGVTAGAVPGDTCGANTYLGNLNGKPVCIVQSNQTVAATGDPVTSSSSSSSVQSVSGANTTTTTTTTAADGTQTVTASTVVTATGAPVSSTTTSTGPSAVPSAGSGSAYPINSTSGEPEGSVSDFCSRNPSADLCATTTSGAGASVSGLYSADSSGRTFASVISAFKSSVLASPIYSASVGFFSLGSLSGTCADMSTTFTMLSGSWTVDIGQYLCGSWAATAYPYLAAGLLLIATGLAFSIAIL